MNIVIDDFGMGLYKKSERLVVKKKGKLIQEIPFFDVEAIFFMTNGAVLSTDVIKECMEQGIQIHFLDYKQQPIASIYSPMLHATVKTRREQILSVKDYRSVEMTKKILRAKITNQHRLLKYYLKSRKGQEEYQIILDYANHVIAHLEELEQTTGNSIIDVRDKFFSIEARSAKKYWDGVQKILEKRIAFPGREHRGTNDPVNMMFNYGYAILGGYVQSAILRAGLEPFAGILHTDRPGKSSLQYDLIEIFRQPVVDKVVISLLSKGFTPKIEDNLLNLETRNKLKDKIINRLESKEPYNGKKYRIKTIIQIQAREVASFFRENTPFNTFIGSW
ncbi:CRISPR-associated endonuclease Cas1 [Vulcanibacillus modesticaldus]|uniref:CRISPR-associated endonuclease Cas1 n=1 Tax=Vulcanibacillus modesticaldus TaxID=337097 RepID=A0A1D2YX51_9BACI|nr:CRISPR-associated endonuclease Cas1 [Vulcanibacillus modesticaldus]OEG00197.1 CRISPR-associated endonuclease Cas1 [Vulcanibacillus modesticaldus]